MHRLPLIACLALAPTCLLAQAPGKFPPDSLVNVKVLPKSTPVTEVIGTMRNFAGGLGVRCHFCHKGEEGQPLSTYDFASDDKRTKEVARQMMRMVEEINRRLDTIPKRPDPAVRVTCRTCHHGVSRPMPLSDLLVATAQSAGADSAIRAYRALRERWTGRDAYDFGEPTLSTAAFRLGRAGKVDDAFLVLGVNEQLFPTSSATQVFRGNLELMRGDTTAAAAAFREAVKRDSTNGEARGRLRDLGLAP